MFLYNIQTVVGSIYILIFKLKILKINFDISKSSIDFKISQFMYKNVILIIY